MQERTPDKYHQRIKALAVGIKIIATSIKLASSYGFHKQKPGVIDGELSKVRRKRNILDHFPQIVSRLV